MSRNTEKKRPGRVTNQLQFFNKMVMKAMWKNAYAWPFYEPVDTVKLGIVDYHNIIKKPMDLGTIKRRLETNWYHSAKDCLRDFNQMFTNCYIYNNPGEDVVLMAQSLERILLQKIAQMPQQETEILPSGKKPRTSAAAATTSSSQPPTPTPSPSVASPPPKTTPKTPSATTTTKVSPLSKPPPSSKVSSASKVTNSKLSTPAKISPKPTSNTVSSKPITTTASTTVTTTTGSSNTTASSVTYTSQHTNTPSGGVHSRVTTVTSSTASSVAVTPSVVPPSQPTKVGLYSSPKGSI